MDLSVVVPTLNGRDRLAATLDSLAAHAPDAEVIVVNGPSADGTTGMVRERDDVDRLVEISARTVNVARNAGVDLATGGAVALLEQGRAVGQTWVAAVTEGLADADAVTGPTRPTRSAGDAASPERRRIAKREVTYFDGGNAAFDADTLDRLDGFDEYLETGGARDAAHRLAGMGRTVGWRPRMSVRHEFEADGGRRHRDWGWKYRALAYRLAKNYGLRPTVLRRTLSHAVADAGGAARRVFRGEEGPSSWFGAGRDVLAGIASGYSDGLVARARDRSETRNPHGLSKRADRAVTRYDWR